MPAEGELFTVSFAVPGAPRGKGRPRTAVIAGRAQIYTDAKTRSEEGAIRSIAAGVMGGQTPFEGAVILRLCAYRPIPSGFSQKRRASAERGEIVPISKPDADNYLKIIDALNGIVWRDDSQVVTAIVHKRFSDRPRLVIEVRSMVTA